MPVLIDSNIVLDVVTDDPVWADGSDEANTRHQAGGLIANPIIYAELCTGAASASEMDELLESLKLGVQEIPRDGLFLAAKAFLQYRPVKVAPRPQLFPISSSAVTRKPSVSPS